MRTVYKLDNIALEQHDNKGKRFRVTYGKQVTDNMDYRAACFELGACIMHSLACDGLIDNTEGE
jgi:hypothetical protein